MSYDSSSEDSPPTSPIPNKPASSSASSFNFNLGLLALVASTEQEKRTNKVANADQQLQEPEKQAEEVSNSDEVKEINEKEKMVNWFEKVEEEEKKIKENDKSNEVKCSAFTMESDVSRDQQMIDAPRITEEYPTPHSLLCDGRLLRLHVPHHPGNQNAFAKQWKEGKVRAGCG